MEKKVMEEQTGTTDTSQKECSNKRNLKSKQKEENKMEDIIQKK